MKLIIFLGIVSILLLCSCASNVSFSAPNHFNPVCVGPLTGISDSLEVTQTGDFSAYNHYDFSFFSMAGSVTSRDVTINNTLSQVLHSDPGLSINNLTFATHSRLMFLLGIVVVYTNEHNEIDVTGKVNRIPSIDNLNEEQN